MSIPVDHLEALIVSILAVNSYGLEKAYSLLPALRKSGLTDSSRVPKLKCEKVMMLLAASGYERGLLTEMMAARLVSLMKTVSDGELDGLGELVANNKRVAAVEMLCAIRGIGPKVASDAWAMMRSGTES